MQRSDENDDSQWGNGRAIKSIAGRVGRDVISFRPRVCPYHATHTNTGNGDTRHSLIHGIRDDCMHGIKAELCKHAEAEDFASRNKRSFLTYGARGVGLSLDGIRLGATARAKPRPVCPKIHLKPGGRSHRRLGPSLAHPCQEGATSCPLDSVPLWSYARVCWQLVVRIA